MTDDALLSALCGIMATAADLVRASSPGQVDRKAHQDYVTDVDRRLDAYLETALVGLHPGIPVLSEERAAALAAPVPEWWIVDPVDGTGNLMAGLPFVGVAVALVDARGPRVAAVAAPFQGRLWTAIRGRGAQVNGIELRLPAVPPELVVASTGLLDRLHAGADRAPWLALRRAGKLRNLGAQSLHLCGVAQGWFAAALSVEARIWDEAAGGLVLREAGGIWRSAADAADWRDPGGLMALPGQESLACHPAVLSVLDPVLPHPDFRTRNSR